MKFKMTRVHLFGALCFFFAMVGEILSLNYVSETTPKFTFFSRAAALPENSEPSPKNETVPESRAFSSIVRRKPGVPYTILYPLTFDNRGGKSLNITLQKPQPPAQEDQVQSRVMNQPQPYPNFIYSLPIPEIPLLLPDEYDNSDRPSIAKVVQLPPPKQDNAKPQTFPEPSAPPVYDKSYLQQPPPTNQYKFHSPRLVSLPSPPPNPQSFQRPQAFDKNNPFIAYLPVLKYNKTKSQPRSTVPPTTTTKGTNPPFQYSKSTVPKFKTLPLQAYNKATFVPSPVIPPPVTGKLQQQFAACICVPYYLCKDGIINSGGRLRRNSKRPARSLNYGFSNKTLPAFAVQSKRASAFAKRQSAEPNTCQPNEICCQIQFADNVDDEDDGNYYPVATPPPEPSYPSPPRYPGNPGMQYDVCGIRKVYGVQRRQKQLQYTADVAEFGEYPWQAAILKKNVGDKNLYLCGGVLIAPQWIATVAHCVTKDKSSPLLVRLGEWDVNRKDEVYPYVEKDVTTVVIHPDFDPESLENDLALIRIITPVDPRIPHITQACLPFPGQIFDDQRCWVSGWGKDFFGPKGAYQNVLKEVDVPVVSRPLCSTELRSTNLGPEFKLHPGFLCAGGEAGKDACTGDGGSPLVCTSNGIWYVVGLVSWGIGCGQAGIPGIYVNVLYYSDWINSITRR